MPECSRRRALQAVAGGAVGTLPGCLDELGRSNTSSTVAPAADAAWPQPRADARNTGTSEAATIPGDPPDRDWRFEVEVSLDAGLADGSYEAVVGDGTVYTALIRRPTDLSSTDGYSTTTPTRATSATPEPVPSKTLEVYAVDADTGDLEWRRDVDLGPFASKSDRAIALSEAGLHLGAQIASGSGQDGEVELEPTVVTLSRDDGSVQHRGGPLVAEFTVGEDRLYGLGVDPDSGDPGYLGVDPTSGDVGWRASPAEGYAGQWLTVDDDHLIAPAYPPDTEAETRRLVAWSLDDGSRAWRSDPLPDSGARVPHAVGADTVVAVGERGAEPGERATLVGLDAGDGARRFTHDTDDPVPFAPVVLDGTALFVTYVGLLSPEADDPATSTLYAVDLDDGTLRYATDLGTAAYGSPVGDGERVLVPGMPATVVDPDDGSTVWEAAVPTPSATTAERTGTATAPRPDSVSGIRRLLPGRERLFGHDQALGIGPTPIVGYGGP